jgi:hypothetical protein
MSAIRTVELTDLATRQDLAGLERRFDGLEHRFDVLEERFDGLEKRFDGLEQRLAGIDARIDRLFYLMVIAVLGMLGAVTALVVRL